MGSRLEPLVDYTTQEFSWPTLWNLVHLFTRMVFLYISSDPTVFVASSGTLQAPIS